MGPRWPNLLKMLYVNVNAYTLNQLLLVNVNGSPLIKIGSIYHEWFHFE